MGTEVPRASAGRPGSAGRYVFWALVLLLLLAYLPVLGGRVLQRAWTREDGPVESAGALAFFAASCAFGAVYRASRRGGRTFWTARLFKGHPGYLALCAALFVVGMEEISWGQRVLGLKTPDAIARVNRQRELNLHNLEWFHGHDRNHQRKSALELTHNMDRLFAAFNIAVGVLLPLGWRLPPWRPWLERVGAPVLTLAVGLLFLANYAASKFLERLAPRHAVVEIKECNAALVWLGLGVLAWLACRRGPAVAAPAAEAR